MTELKVHIKIGQRRSDLFVPLCRPNTDMTDKGNYIDFSDYTHRGVTCRACDKKNVDDLDIVSCVKCGFADFEVLMFFNKDENDYTCINYPHCVY